MSVDAVKSFFERKHVQVPDEWVTACMDWLKSENPNQSTSNQTWWCQQAYDQWLHSDITELGTNCLPFRLSQHQKTDISGYFALQVNQLRDVGHAAYAQLQTIRKKGNENEKVNADQPRQASWEPKSSRMLMMQLTDGTSVVQGMEYRIIPQLNVNLKPGTKILVEGSIPVRRGVLMLMKENVTVLGGEVDSMLSSNAAENVLARKLGLEESENPAEYTAPPASQVTPSQVSQYYPSQVNQSNIPRSSQQSQLGNARTSQQSQHSSGRHTIQSQRGNTRPSQQVQPSPRISASMPPPLPPRIDDFDEDDFFDTNMEAAIAELENQPSQSSQSSQSSQLSQPTQMSRLSQPSHLSLQSEKKLPPSGSRLGQSTSLGTPSWKGNQSRNGNKRMKPEDDFDDDPFQECMELNEEFFNDDFDDDISVISQRILSTKNSTGTQHSKQNRNSSFSSVPTKRLSTTGESKLPIKQKTALSQPKLSNFLSRQSSSSLSHTIKASSTSGRSLSTNKETITSQVTKTPPFSYICFLPNNVVKEQVFIVKGFIMTLLSKLEQRNGEWNLTVKINDGTGSKDVDIHNEVLKEMIGMTATEMQTRRLEAKNNPSAKAELAGMVVSCQKQLISLCGLLHLHTGTNLPRPVIKEISPVTALHMKQLQKRAESI